MYFKLFFYINAALSLAAASIIFGKSDHMSVLVEELFVSQVAQIAPELDLDIEKLDWTIVKTRVRGARLSYKDFFSIRVSGTVYPSALSLIGSPAFTADLRLDNNTAEPIEVDFQKENIGFNLDLEIPEYPLIDNQLFASDFGIGSGTLSTTVNIEGKAGNVGFEINDLTFKRQPFSPKGKGIIDNLTGKWFSLASVPEYLTNGSILGNIGSVSLSGIVDYNKSGVEIKGVNLLTRVMRIVGSVTFRDGLVDGQLKLVVKNGKVSEVKFILEQLFGAEVGESNLYSVEFAGESGVKIKALKK